MSEVMDDDHKMGETQFSYCPDAGEVEGPVFCGVCGQEALVTRNCKGPTSFLMAMGGSTREYDFFICPDASLGWHEQVVSIRKEINQTASERLKNMLREEVCEILERTRNFYSQRNQSNGQ